MSTQNTALTETKSPTLQSMLDASKGQIAIALPKHLTPERFIRLALTTVRQSETLQKCTPISIVACVVQASQLGLELDGILGDAYMIPRWNKNLKPPGFEANFQVGYRGLINLARRSGLISTIYSEPVYECDRFEVELGTAHTIKHIPNYDDPKRGSRDKDGNLIGLRGCYAVVIFKDGTPDFEYMSMTQLNNVRASSQSGGSSYSPWHTHPEEMYKKCPIRRLAKRLPLSPEFRKAAILDEYIDQGAFADDVPEIEQRAIQQPQRLSTVAAPAPSTQPKTIEAKVETEPPSEPSVATDVPGSTPEPQNEPVETASQPEQESEAAVSESDRGAAANPFANEKAEEQKPPVKLEGDRLTKQETAKLLAVARSTEMASKDGKDTTKLDAALKERFGINSHFELTKPHFEEALKIAGGEKLKLK